MSARPKLVRIPDEELDVLISRSFDGDLSPEEEQEFQKYVASDPDAARRREDVAAAIAALKALPAPEPPFALATRVNSQVAERSKGVGSVWHRFGIYPPPGMVAGALGVLAMIGVLFVVASPRTRPTSVAQKAPSREGAVDVFFQPAPAKEEAKAADRKETAQKAARPSEGKTVAKKTVEETGSFAPAARTAALDEGAGPKEKVATQEETAIREQQGRIDAPSRPRSAAASRAPEAAFAPAAPKEPLRNASGPVALRWSIAIVGPPAASGSWQLKRAPEVQLPARPIAAHVLVTLDPEGKVVAMRPSSGAAIPAEIAAMASGLVFEPVARDAAPKGLELEVTISAR